MQRTPPHNLEAEESVLGACLLSSRAIEAVLPMLTQSDFYRPSHGWIFEGIRRLYGEGAAVDVVTVADQLKKMGMLEECGDTTALLGLQSNTPAISSANRYAFIVAQHALARSGIRIAGEAIEHFYDPTNLERTGEYMDAWQAEIKNIDSPAMERTPDDVDLDEFMQRPPESRKPWVVEGLLRQDWRAMLVGREGEGKTVATMTVGVCASYGVHPFSHREIPPANVLIIDLENPTDVIHDRLRWISDACRAQPKYETERQAALWHRPGGIDLRKRTDRLQLEDVLRRRRPNLVVLGPLYKAYHKKAMEGHEEVASEVQQILDDLRTRFDFALLMEHHAPKGAGGTLRELVPFGSSLWLRWSELGFSLVPQSRDFPSKRLDIESYRGDRVKHAWPKAIEWGSEWNLLFPWKGIYDAGEHF